MIIFLDMDGVLADFCKGAYMVHGKQQLAGQPDNWNFYKEWGMTPDEFWAAIENEEFWANLDRFSWTVKLYEKCLELGDPMIFLTSPCMSPYCLSGKMLWLT